MPTFNSWNVSYSTISFVERALLGHAKVASFKRSDDIVFDIQLKDGKHLKMLLLNEYTLGLAAIHRALAEFPGIEYIVTGANWNGYTKEAKQYGKENDLGLFVLGEFFGSLYWSNPKQYYQKDADGNPIYHYKSA
jgi:hypothetical protein